MNKNIEILKEPLTSLTTQENFLMDSNDVTNLEIDLTTLGMDFETFNVIEHEDYSDEYVGVQITKSYSKFLDRILISSLDLVLFKENISELFDEYEIEINIESSKTIGKSIRQYQLIINIFKDRNLWEETFYA